MKKIKELLKEWNFSEERKKNKKFVKYEFQDFGIRLAYKLNDLSHKSLYIRLAKSEKRKFLERAYNFACDYPGTENKNKGKLFMWALKKIKSGESNF